MSTSSLTSSTGSSELDKEAFLMLLVTQFQYQDPLNPMDDTTFISQLAQFSALEQQMTTNENLESLISIQESQAQMYSVNYIGKEVLARGYGISVQDSLVTTVQYSLDTAAVSGTVTIYDANNEHVATLELPALSSGIHTFTWDGKDSSGNTVADGVYTVSISAVDADGNYLIPDTQVGGLVTGISTYDGVQYLTLSDDRVVALSNVREVLSPGSLNDDGTIKDSSTSSSSSSDSSTSDDSSS